MTDYEVLTLFKYQPRVEVTANDYAYTGWLAGAFTKRTNAVRCVVEDGNSRLFIHSPSQLVAKDA